MNERQAEFQERLKRIIHLAQMVNVAEHAYTEAQDLMSLRLEELRLLRSVLDSELDFVRESERVLEAVREMGK